MLPVDTICLTPTIARALALGDRFILSDLYSDSLSFKLVLVNPCLPFVHVYYRLRRYIQKSVFFVPPKTWGAYMNMMFLTDLCTCMLTLPFVSHLLYIMLAFVTVAVVIADGQ